MDFIVKTFIDDKQVDSGEIQISNKLVYEVVNRYIENGVLKDEKISENS